MARRIRISHRAVGGGAGSRCEGRSGIPRVGGEPSCSKASRSDIAGDCTTRACRGLRRDRAEDEGDGLNKVTTYIFGIA